MLRENLVPYTKCKKAGAFVSDAASRLEKTHTDDITQTFPGFGLKALLPFFKAAVTNLLQTDKINFMRNSAASLDSIIYPKSERFNAFSVSCIISTALIVNYSILY